MAALFFRLTGIGPDTTALEYRLMAGVFTSAIVATAMVAATRLLTTGAASNAVVAYLP